MRNFRDEYAGAKSEATIASELMRSQAPSNATSLRE
jgi:hypothetical protein